MVAERLYRAILTMSEDGVVTLSADELKHLVRVRRLASGGRFLGLLEGRAWQLCELHTQDGSWSVRLVGSQAPPVEPALQVTLAQSLIKRDKFEWVLQKATELGVTRIVPLITTHTIVAARNPNRKQTARWSRILTESVKQCGRDSIPTMAPVSTVQETIETDRYDLIFYLDETEGTALKTFMEPAPCLLSACFFVGPEGGWSESERAYFLDQGICAISLGKTVLRSETVSVAVLTVLQFLHGEFGGGRDV